MWVDLPALWLAQFVDGDIAVPVAFFDGEHRDSAADRVLASAVLADKPLFVDRFQPARIGSLLGSAGRTA
jgi:hypothetical protein